MKILPINLYYNIFHPQNTKTQEFALTNAQNKDVFTPSFSGVNSTLNDAKAAGGIHCPICGTKMLTSEQLESILEQTYFINSTRDFYNLLNENRDYITPYMQKILRHIEKFNYFDTDFHQYVSESYNRACRKQGSMLTKTTDTLMEIIKDIPEEERAKIKEKVLNSPVCNEHYSDYKETVLEVLLPYNLPSKIMFEIKKSVLMPMKDSFEYLSIFRAKNWKECTNQELAYNICKKLFQKSLISETKMTKFITQDDPNNEILVCHKCKYESSNKSFLTSTAPDNPDFKKNIIVYAQDITKFYANNNSGTTNAYTRTLFDLVYNITKGQISFDIKDLKMINRLNHIFSRHEDFTPISQTKIDVPCACCGSTMLPHDIKIKIDNETKHCRSIKDYARVITKYDKYIGHYARPGVDIFLKLVQSEPELPLKEFAIRLQEEMDKVSQEELKETLQNFIKKRYVVARYNSIEELENFDKIYNIMFNYVKSDEAKDFNYTNMLMRCFKDIDLNKSIHKSVYFLLRDYKEVCFKNWVVKQNDLDAELDENPIQTFVFKVFKSDLATADHLLAVKKGGDKSKFNIIGLCRDCNQLKSNKNVGPWIGQNPLVRENLPKQLNVIDSMSQMGIITGYENWAKNIANTLYELSGTHFDIRDKFN